MSDHYETLGVARSASPSEIQAAVNRLNSSARAPRSWGTDPPTSARAVAEAQYWLGDAARRQEYDLTLALPEPRQAEVNRQVGGQQGSGDQGVAGSKVRASIPGFHGRSKNQSLIRAFRAAGGGFRRGLKLGSPAAQPTPPAYRSKAGTSKTNEGADLIIGCLMLAALSVWGAVAGYGWLNNLGWVDHGKIVSIQIDGNWMMGEYRPCRSYPALDDLECTQRGAGAAHLLPVTFWGRIDRNEPSDWKCQRQHGVLASADSVVCWATD